jgi:hypothetical protein
MNPALLNGPWKVHPHVVFRQQTNLCKIIHLDNPKSQTLVLRDSAYFVWQAIIEGCSWSEIVTRLNSHYGSRADEELVLVKSFINELCQRDIILPD